ncbi:bifunctional folylpolyglutamate synthase/dihydrofolate synthase [Picrophilus oshimae]|uniref:Dihydrofolate synthase / folylpolyglutamate synthase n=1 Tax=Picrophilus torridus (strain ATCC 700027 / DSM 9790 / JCM 10055 / NBRC 100828 / KAW 2/3) TaxID=1122961 RepID=A0A8G2FX71_PICTO|nr:folylpolyglutamate synthase/dihydrofolate synthase family protein [Picrophilus oshimae]SMD31091.1 dihydrofolate synthase / folylpolyglutamate synthase [Picrophilus oshimae DSM 9789]
MDDILNYLYELKREGIKLGLDTTRAFAEHLGNPQDKYKKIHIAGTNGKGSISSYIYNILRQRYNTGLYTSPHLIKFNERIIFNKEMISDDYIINFISENREYIDKLSKIKMNPTFFETTTVMAFKYFYDMHADYAAIEVGLGGRLDSTNIIIPEISIIGQIGYEHYQKLGCSLTSIAYEKGGIIKPGIPVVLQDKKPEVLAEIKKLSQVRKSKLILSEDYSKSTEPELYNFKMVFDLKTPLNEYHIESNNLGLYQVKNIKTAVAALENMDTSINKHDVESGIDKAIWHGRMEIIRASPLVIIDSAHNPPAASNLVPSFKKFIKKKPLLLIGMLSDKDVFSFLTIMRQLSDKIVLTMPNEPDRALDPDNIKDIASSIYRDVKIIKDPLSAYDYSLKNSDCILVCGSMYLIGDIMSREKVGILPFIDIGKKISKEIG